MSFWTSLHAPAEHELLVGFYDLTAYTRYSAKVAPLDLMRVMAGYFFLTGGIIAAAGGKLIKTIGDAGLAAFPVELADAGVMAFREVKRQGDAWLAEHDYRGRAKIKLHVGPVAVGPVGAPRDERLDIYGSTVNFAAVLESHGFAMSPAVFRKLSSETRKFFQKHTPPISYIEHDAEFMHDIRNWP